MAMNLLRLVQIAAEFNGLRKMLATFMNIARQGNGGVRRLADAEHDQAMRRLLHVVEDVVDLGCQGVDVFTIEGGDEAAIECLDDAFDDLVALFFLELQLSATHGEIVEVGHHLEKLAGSPRQRHGRFVEHVKELHLSRYQAESHAPIPRPSISEASSRIHRYFMNSA